MSTKTNACIVMGSSRSDGNTSLLAQYIAEMTKAPLFDLNEYSISYYSYKHDNNDDFIKLFEEVSSFNTQIYVTPVYWYSMSAVMKTFFDRISEPLRTHKHLTDSLRGKKMLLFNMSSGPELYPFFHLPFEYSAEYLHMNFGGYVHCWLENKQLPSSVQNDVKLLLQKSNLII